MLLFNGLIGDFNFAAKLKGRDELLSCQMYLDAGRAPETPNNVQCEQPDPKLRLGCCFALIFGWAVLRADSSILMSGAEKMFLSGEASYPVERTLLTGGVVEAGCQSLTLKRRVETPHMAGLTYAAPTQSLFGGHGEPHDYRAVRHGRVIRCAMPAPQLRSLDWC